MRKLNDNCSVCGEELETAIERATGTHADCRKDDEEYVEK